MLKKNIYGVKPLEDKKALDMSNEQDITDYTRTICGVYPQTYGRILIIKE